MGTITYQIPQANQQNATEDPKIATALTTLLAFANGEIDLANLSATLQGLVTIGAWVPLTPTNTWVSGGNPTPAYRQEGVNIRLRGYLTTATPGSSAFTLPAGARPTADSIYQTSAALQIIAASGLCVPGASPMILNGITFPTT